MFIFYHYSGIYFGIPHVNVHFGRGFICVNPLLFRMFGVKQSSRFSPDLIDLPFTCLTVLFRPSIPTSLKFIEEPP